MTDVHLHPTVAAAATRAKQAPPAETGRRATDRFNPDEPVTECDLCIVLTGCIGLVLVYGLIWAFEFIARLQAVVHEGVTP